MDTVLKKNVELDPIDLGIKGLRKLLKQKENETGADSFIFGLIQLRKKDINALELFYNARDRNPALREEVIKNFTMRIEEIRKDIENIII